jgi:hypothetical protein
MATMNCEACGEPIYRWRVRARLPVRFGTHCRVLARGKMNSALVQFIADGKRVITSRNYLRKV